MPALTTDEYKQLIIDEVDDASNFVAGRIDTLWAMFDGAGTTQLRYYYTLRKACELMMRYVRKQPSYSSVALSIKLAELMGNLQTMRNNASGEITRLEKLLASNGTSAAGMIEAVVPIDPPAGTPDANDPALLGSPYVPEWGTTR